MQFSYSRINFFCFFIIGIFLVGCSKNQLPTCEILSPTQGTDIEQGSIVVISVDANDSDGIIKEVSFFYDDSLIASINEFPFNYKWDTRNIALGQHRLILEAKDDIGAEADHEITINIISSPDISPVDIVDSIAPTDILLSDTVIYDNCETNIFVGTLTSVDEGLDNYFSYSIGSFLQDDNSCFNIHDNCLYTSWYFFYDIRLDYIVNIISTDSGGNSYTEKFHLTVNRDVFKARLHQWDHSYCYNLEPLYGPENNSYWEKIEKVEGGNVINDNDFSAEFQIFSDNNHNLAIAIHVIDSSIVDSETLEGRDFVDIFLSADTTSVFLDISKDFSWHLRLFRDKDTSLVLDRLGIVAGADDTDIENWLKYDLCVNTVDLESEYYSVLIIPAPLGFMRFDIGVSNNSNRKTKDVIWWYSGSGGQDYSNHEMRLIFVPSRLIQ